MARATVTDRDRGYRALMRAVRGMTRGALSVGIPEAVAKQPHPGGDLTVGEVAQLHERGTSRMPARPFLSSWFARGGERNLRKSVRDALTASVRRHRPPWPALHRDGARYVLQVRAGFRFLRPLAPSTRRQKGSARVLVETGTLRDAIGYEVEER